MGRNVETGADTGHRRARKSAGGAFECRGAFFIRVTIGPQKRLAQHAPWATTLEAAAARGKLVQAWVSRLRDAGQVDFVEKVVELGAKADEETLAALGAKVDAIAGNDFERVEEPSKANAGTFRELGERWTSGELHRLHPDHIDEKASVTDDEERLEKHVYPHVQNVPLRAFTRAHADLVMAKLPATLKPATRRQVAQLVNRVVRLGQFVGLIDRSPLPPGWLPKAPKADSIAKESLLPSEEARLLAGRNDAGETVVPLVYRVLYAFLHREGMRKGEVQRLTWGDVDLKKGIVSLDENKTDRPRSWVMTPSMARALTAWSAAHPKAEAADPVFPGVTWSKLAPHYRALCEAVGIDRARLFEKKANKLRLRAHDARAFFITAGIHAGRDVLWLTDRTGHTTLAMLRRYERDVRRWRELGEVAPVDAHAAIPETAAAFTAANAAAAVDNRSAPKVATTEKCTGRDLNPYASRRRNLNPLRLPVSPPVRCARGPIAPVILPGVLAASSAMV
jgi:integrase